MCERTSFALLVHQIDVRWRRRQPGLLQLRGTSLNILFQRRAVLLDIVGVCNPMPFHFGIGPLRQPLIGARGLPRLGAALNLHCTVSRSFERGVAVQLHTWRQTEASGVITGWRL